ncbi:L,D-transpeptidase [Verrucomicrobiaceae bacterium 5K15]|uniref:L,D-transpeptidase n=1 Tax=Oceaniferula flava TaxID=2800421 RepID=A0AAE2VD58_9BACT|nr:L,D-transpeptidase [Oceaniferula flavus]MBK1854159.1 L,D-transpeptidase [Oceaniferula flavus]MBM1135465.1 L,D-transpeptidase [Oceaniferula flavus]
MHIRVSISDQTLYLLEQGELVISYPISSAANGLGFEEGSYCTPTGRFEVCEKIGDGEAPGTVFKSRLPIGHWDGAPSDADLVLTRILRLNGLDPENANSRDRYIYIHGTNQEHLLGQPASCGCIRLSNQDVIDLYDRIEEGTPMTIEP